MASKWARIFPVDDVHLMEFIGIICEQMAFTIYVAK
jgi:hypothetical protein